MRDPNETRTTGDADAPTASPVRQLGRQAHVSVGSDARAAARSREFVRAMLAVWHADDLDDVAELLTTELVTNAVRHAMSDPRVELTWTPPTLRIAVIDTSHTNPVTIDAPDENGGYGMHLIADLAQAFGVEHQTNGKIVWCDITRSPTP